MCLLNSLPERPITFLHADIMLLPLVTSACMCISISSGEGMTVSPYQRWTSENIMYYYRVILFVPPQPYPDFCFTRAYCRDLGQDGEVLDGDVGGDRHPLDLVGNPEARNDLPVPDDPEDMPMNAPGGMGMMVGGGGGEDMRRRDMVDYLYMFMMIGFLVLVAYLTGSLGRLLIFVSGIIFMLL